MIRKPTDEEYLEMAILFDGKGEIPYIVTSTFFVYDRLDGTKLFYRVRDIDHSDGYPNTIVHDWLIGTNVYYISHTTWKRLIKGDRIIPVLHESEERIERWEKEIAT